MKSYERIKNFSTSIAVEKTISEIEKMLSAYGVSRIMKEYDVEGNPNALSFEIQTTKGNMPVKLPLKTRKMLEVFKVQVSAKKLPKKFWGGDWAEAQAARVGWRIIKDWLDAQLTLIGIDMVKVEEIFLPYIYNQQLGKTMFELLEEKNFNVNGLLEDRSNHRNIDEEEVVELR